MISLVASRSERKVARSLNQRAMVDFLRHRVLEYPGHVERLHAIFLDEYHAFLGDASIGHGSVAAISARMRNIFGAALNMDASGIVVAHNHPSGHCRPSSFDIDATQRLKVIGKALDIELLDHLIFTNDAVYSMRAGGNL